MSGPGRWLSVVGIGEDGLDGLCLAARAMISQAQLVVGGRRHLELVADLVRGRALAWPAPPQAAFPEIQALRGQPVCVVATGDPFFYGVGSLLAKEIPAAEMTCMPGVSSFSLAASRLGWPLQDCALVSLHGRSLAQILPHLQPGSRALALSWDGSTPAQLAKLLTAHDFGAASLTVCEALGGPRERIRSALAGQFDLDDIHPLNLVAIETPVTASARAIQRSSGLPDSWFEHDGQLTKQEVRAATLAALAPRRGELLWDIGAGAGSIGVEWMLSDAANRAIAIERDRARAERIARNATALGVPDLSVVVGSAPAALADLPAPDAAFVGGGVSDARIVEAAWAALPSGGRLVANAVTLAAQSAMMQRFQELGGDLKTIQIARADRVGSFHSLRPERSVLQWAIRKP